MLRSALRKMGDPEGPVLSTAEMRDYRLYVRPSLIAIGVAFTKETDEEKEEIHKNIIQIVDTFYQQLRKVFKYYSNSEIVRRAEALQQNVMSRSEFEKLLRDCELSPDLVEKWWPVELKSLEPQQFIELLVVISSKAIKEPGLSLTDKFQKLVCERITAKALFVTIAEFKATVHMDRTENVMNEHRPALQKIFTYYAAGKATHDTNVQNAKEIKEISYKEFRQFMTDCKCYDDNCTQYTMQLVFTKMQDDYDLGLSFTEFLEILCAIAVYKNPAPYLPLHIRVKDFITGSLLPNLSKQPNLRNITNKRVG